MQLVLTADRRGHWATAPYSTQADLLCVAQQHVGGRGLQEKVHTFILFLKPCIRLRANMANVKGHKLFAPQTSDR
jgi:hypothetical protein